MTPKYNGAVSVLTRAPVYEALERLDVSLAARGTRAELYLVEGAVMCVALNARASTKDVDGWFTQPEAVRAAAREWRQARGKSGLTCAGNNLDARPAFKAFLGTRPAPQCRATGVAWLPGCPASMKASATRWHPRRGGPRRPR